MLMQLQKLHMADSHTGGIGREGSGLGSSLRFLV